MKTKPKEVSVFVDGTNWLYEVGEAMDGNTVYPSASDLKKDGNCWKNCGIVKVKMTFEKWVLKGKSFKSTGVAGAKDFDYDTMRLDGAIRHLERLEQKTAKQRDKVIQLKATIKRKK